MVLAFFQSPAVQNFARLLSENAAKDAEIEQLRARNAELERTAEARRPAKGRSPAVWRFRILGSERIDMVINTREFPGGKTINALRIYVPLEDQPDGPGYWDITRKKAIAMLEPLAERFAGTGAYFTLRQNGTGLTSWDSLSYEPPPTP